MDERDEHDLCVDEFCVQTGKPGLCLGQHRTALQAAQDRVNAAKAAPVQVAAPNLRKVPAAPVVDPNAEIGAKRGMDSLVQAHRKAQMIAETAGLTAPQRMHIAGAVGAYARSLHQAMQTRQALERARAQLQARHDSAVKANVAAVAHAAAVTAHRQATHNARVQKATLHAAIAAQKGHHSAVAFWIGEFGDGVHTRSMPPGKCRYCDNPATKGVVWAEGMGRIPVDDQHLAKAKAEVAQEEGPDGIVRIDEARGGQWVKGKMIHHYAHEVDDAALDILLAPHSPEPLSMARFGLLDLELSAPGHEGCRLTEFCRNPLHPGPCKGWKHMLHAVSPGAYHALEKARVEKLNAKRKAKIAALQAEGKAVPKYLLKEITYAEVPKAPVGSPFKAPTVAEAEKALPPSQVAIADKLSAKHVAAKAMGVPSGPLVKTGAPGEKVDATGQKFIPDGKGGYKPAPSAGAKAKTQAHVDALHSLIVGTGMGPDTPQTKAAAAGAVEAAEAKLQPGQKLTEAPGMPNVLTTLTDKVNKVLTPAYDKAGKVGPGQTAIYNQIKAHLDQGKPGLPPVVEDMQKAQKGRLFAAPGTPSGKLTPTGKMLGTHGAQVHTDENGDKFLVKPPPFKNGGFIAAAEEGASKLAAKVGVETPKVVAKPDGSSVQQMIPDAKPAFPGGFDPAKLTSDEVLTIQKHHALDWLVGNHDGHEGNFVKGADGKIQEVDKGQAFKHYHEDKLSSTYHPNAKYGEKPPVYNKLLQAAAKGQVELHDPNSGELGDFIQKIQDIPDDQLKELFRPYAEQAAKAGMLPGAPNGGKLGPSEGDPTAVQNAFLDKIVQRKNGLKKAFAGVVAEHTPKKAEPEKPKAPEAPKPDKVSAPQVDKEAGANAAAVIAKEVGLGDAQIEKMKIGFAKEAEGHAKPTDSPKIAMTAQVLAKKLVGNKVGDKKMSLINQIKLSDKVTKELTHAFDTGEKPGPDSVYEKVQKATTLKALTDLAKAPSSQVVGKSYIPVSKVVSESKAEPKAEKFPTFHPDVMAALDAVKPSAGSHNQEILMKVGKVTKDDFDKLPPVSQSGLKVALTQVAVNSEAWKPNAEKIYKYLTGKDMFEPAEPKPAGGYATAGEALAAHPHVVEAVEMATGAKKATAKMQLTAYEKLSKQEFDQLGPKVGEQIKAQLQAAHAKFLDPAKKAQAQALIDKFGAQTPVEHTQAISHAESKLELATKQGHALAEIAAKIPGAQEIPLFKGASGDKIAAKLHKAIDDDEAFGSAPGGLKDYDTTLETLGDVLTLKAAQSVGLGPGEIPPDLLGHLSAEMEAVIATGDVSKAPVLTALPEIAKEAQANGKKIAEANGWSEDAPAVANWVKAAKTNGIKMALVKHGSPPKVKPHAAPAGAGSKTPSTAPVEVKPGATISEAKAGQMVQGLEFGKGAVVKEPPEGDIYPIKLVVPTGHDKQVGDYVSKVKASAHGKEPLEVPQVTMAKMKNAPYSTAGSDKAFGSHSTSSVLKAFQSYTSSGYTDINDYLRTNKGKLSTGGPTGTIKAMDAAFKHESSKIDKPITVLRGFSSPKGVFGTAWRPDKSMVGTEFTEHGYSSTTVQMSTARSFAGASYGNPQNSVVMRIYVPKGQNVVVAGKGSSVSGEGEIVLNRGTKYRIVADHGYQNGARHIDVEVVP